MSDVREVVMIGAGPSALSAAIYTTREDIDTVLYEKGVIGGLAAITDKVDNYPGFADGIEGMALADTADAAIDGVPTSTVNAFREAGRFPLDDYAYA